MMLHFYVLGLYNTFTQNKLNAHVKRHFWYANIQQQSSGIPMTGVGLLHAR
jgi:hypothetical protein